MKEGNTIIIDVWLTYLKNNYVSLWCSKNNDLALVVKKYDLKGRTKEDYDRIIQDYIVEANLKRIQYNTSAFSNSRRG